MSKCVRCPTAYHVGDLCVVACSRDLRVSVRPCVCVAGRMSKCVRCPTAYHVGDLCVAACNRDLRVSVRPCVLQAACPSVSAVPRPTTSATCASRPAVGTCVCHRPCVCCRPHVQVCPLSHGLPRRRPVRRGLQ